MEIETAITRFSHVLNLHKYDCFVFVPSGRASYPDHNGSRLSGARSEEFINQVPRWAVRHHQDISQSPERRPYRLPHENG